jgi:hypothetical protein
MVRLSSQTSPENLLALGTSHLPDLDVDFPEWHRILQDPLQKNLDGEERLQAY